MELSPSWRPQMTYSFHKKQFAVEERRTGRKRSRVILRFCQSHQTCWVRLDGSGSTCQSNRNLPDKIEKFFFPFQSQGRLFWETIRQFSEKSEEVHSLENSCSYFAMGNEQMCSKHFKLINYQLLTFFLMICKFQRLLGAHWSSPPAEREMFYSSVPLHREQWWVVMLSCDETLTQSQAEWGDCGSEGHRACAVYHHTHSYICMWAAIRFTAEKRMKEENHFSYIPTLRKKINFVDEIFKRLLSI